MLEAPPRRSPMWTANASQPLRRWRASVQAVFDDVDSLRAVLLADIDTARVAATEDIEGAVERQARAFVGEAESLIDKVFWRALILLGIGLVGLAIVLRFSRAPRTG